MLWLLFKLGDESYGLPSQDVVEVLPLVRLRPVAGAPAFVAGLCDYHGDPVPVVDLNILVHSRPTRQEFGSRIILATYLLEGHPRARLGLLAEGVTDTLQCDQAEFRETGMHLSESPYLGPVRADQGQMVQAIELKSLLTEDVWNLLYSPVGEG